MKSAKVIAVLAAVAGLALAACSSDDGASAPPPVAPLPMEVGK